MNRRLTPRLALAAIAALGVAALGAQTASAATARGSSVPIVVSATSDASGSSNAGALVWSVHPANNSVGTGRPNFGYRADPGASVRDALDVSNRGDETITLKVYAADAFTPQGGGIDLLRSDEKSTDVGAWITLGRHSITLKPQQTVTVPFTLAVPANATPGDHAGGIVTSYTSGSGPFAVERRLGSRVIVRVSGDLAPALQVSHVSVRYGTQFNPFSPSTATVTYTVANTGNVRLDAHPAITVAGPLGMLSTTVATEDLGELLPGNSRDFAVKVPAVWAFFYVSATVRLEPFPSNPNDSASDLDLVTVAGSGGAFALNWGQPILLAVIALLVVAAFWWRRRRRAAVQAAIDAAVEEALSRPDQSDPIPHH